MRENKNMVYDIFEDTGDELILLTTCASRQEVTDYGIHFQASRREAEAMYWSALGVSGVQEPKFEVQDDKLIITSFNDKGEARQSVVYCVEREG